MNRWPEFLIIGAAKSGTTSLYEYLRSHPDVFMPDFKEPAFFADLGVDGIHEQSRYLELFSEASSSSIVGEASVVYLMDPSSPSSIRKTLGDEVKLIALLRNPAKSMYSGWAHNMRKGVESRQAETALLESFSVGHMPLGERHLQYAEQVNYAEQLKRYYDLFSNENILVLIFEEFFNENLPLYNDVCGFLEISQNHRPEEVVHNKGFLEPRSRLLSVFIEKYYGTYCLPLAKLCFPQKLRRAVRCKLDTWNSAGKGQIQPMSEALYERLKQRLSPGVRELEELLGRDLEKCWF